MFGHTLAITNLCLITCLKLGSMPYQTQREMFCKNLILIALLIVFIMHYFHLLFKFNLFNSRFGWVVLAKASWAGEL